MGWRRPITWCSEARLPIALEGNSRSAKCTGHGAQACLQHPLDQTKRASSWAQIGRKTRATLVSMALFVPCRRSSSNSPRPTSAAWASPAGSFGSLSTTPHFTCGAAAHASATSRFLLHTQSLGGARALECGPFLIADPLPGLSQYTDLCCHRSLLCSPRLVVPEKKQLG